MRRNVIDRMALLCTLHADGPKTLRLLREAGCTTIERIVTLPSEKVGTVLNLAPAAARRFTREAQRLLDRLDPDLEQEEVTFPPASEPHAIKPSLSRARVQLAEPEPALRTLGVNRRLDVRDQELLGKVVQRWRDEEPALAPALPPATEEREDLQVLEILGNEVRQVVPEPPVQTELLKPLDLASLDATACEALRVAGILSLEDLATFPIDELVLRSGLTFTRARTLQYLAGRELAKRSKPMFKPEPTREIKPMPKPVREPMPKLVRKPVSEPAIPRAERISPSDRPPVVTLGAQGVEHEDRDGGVAGPFA
ncbi:MAG: hypothetical protein ACI8X5_001066 [Planctomycetota bacterium]|jgi:hypothetical protein